jgi:hypothetical protein
LTTVGVLLLGTFFATPIFDWAASAARQLF